MDTRFGQAITRAFWVFVAAGATAIGLDAANIVNIGTDDPIFGQVLLALITGAVQFVMKYAGGPTAPVETSAGGARALKASGTGSKGANTLAV